MCLQSRGNQEQKLQIKDSRGQTSRSVETKAVFRNVNRVIMHRLEERLSEYVEIVYWYNSKFSKNVIYQMKAGFIN